MSDAHSTADAPQASRKIQRLVLAIIIVLALVTAAWFVAAYFYGQAIDEGRARLANEGIALQCEESSIGGFPARFEWQCANFAVTTQTGTTVTGGALHTVAPVWNPLFTIAEWSGPFQSVSTNGFEAVIDSPLLRASLRLDVGMNLQRLSAVLDPFSLSVQGATMAIANGQTVEFHVRQADADEAQTTPTTDTSTRGDLEVAALILGFSSIFLGGVDQIDLSLTGIVDALAQARATSLPGLIDDWINRSGTINAAEVRLRLDDHAINVAGDVTIAPDRLVDFDGTVATNDLAALVDLMGVDPGNGATAIVAGATLFGRQTTIGDDNATELPLVVERGAVRIGPVTLGQMPPVPF